MKIHLLILVVISGMIKTRTEAQGRIVINTDEEEYKNEFVIDMLSLNLNSEVGRSIIYEVFCGHNRTLVVADPVVNDRLEWNTVYRGMKPEYRVLSLMPYESKRAGINESLLAHELTHFVNNDSISHGTLVDERGYLIPGVSSDEIRAVQVQNQVLEIFGFGGRKFYGKTYIKSKKLKISQKYQGQNVYELEEGISKYLPVRNLPILTAHDFSITTKTGMKRESFKVGATNSYVVGKKQYILELNKTCPSEVRTDRQRWD